MLTLDGPHLTKWDESLHVCWESYTADSKHSGRFLECAGNKTYSLLQVLAKPSRGEAFLDLVLTTVDDLETHIRIGGSLHCRDLALVDFVISGDVSLSKTKVRTLTFRGAHLLPVILPISGGESMGHSVLGDRGSDRSWQLLGDAFLRASTRALHSHIQ